VGSDEAVPALVKVSRTTGWFGRRKRRALKERAVRALRKIDTPKTTAALDDAVREGDRLLKKIVHATQAG
jgi:hypothetical protein